MFDKPEPKKDIRLDLTEEEEQAIADGKYGYDDIINEHMIDVFVINHDGHGNIVYPASYSYLHCRIDELEDILLMDYNMDFVCCLPVDDFVKLKLWFVIKIHAPKMVKGLRDNLNSQ